MVVRVPAGQRHIMETLYYGPGWTGAFCLRDYYKRVELRDLYTLTFFFFARIAEKAQLPVFGVERRCNESIQCSIYVPEGPAQVVFCAS